MKARTIVAAILLMLNLACSSSKRLIVERAPGSDRYASVELHRTAALREKNANDLAVCAWVSEVRDTYLCLFGDRQSMNLSLLRAGLFTQNNAGIVSNYALLNSPLLALVEGHDFTSRDLVRYYAQFKENRPSAVLPSTRQLRQYEDEFWLSALEPALERPDFTLITCTVQNFKSCINHEFLHAQFNSDPGLRALVIEFYTSEVDEKFKLAIERSLREYYDISDRNRLYTEFFAYVGDPVDPSILRFAAKKYRDQLLTYLEAKGRKPILIISP